MLGKESKTMVSVSKPVGTDSPVIGQWIKISGTPKLHFRRLGLRRGAGSASKAARPLHFAPTCYTPPDRTSARDKPSCAHDPESAYLCGSRLVRLSIFEFRYFAIVGLDRESIGNQPAPVQDFQNFITRRTAVLALTALPG